jgi:LytS/YehU family sensor histidine kinase
MKSTTGEKIAGALIGSFFGMIAGLTLSLIAAMGGMGDVVCLTQWAIVTLIGAWMGWKVAAF